MPMASWVLERGVFSNRDREKRHLCQLRGTSLQLALTLYQIEKGRPARMLDELVPNYLATVPVDPYSGKPFHYRISKGEQIPQQDANGEWKERKLVAGQGVVWSVGPDAVDNGGERSAWHSTDSSLSVGGDWLYLVPRWAVSPPQTTKQKE